jgi:hypothetical protein
MTSNQTMEKFPKGEWWLKKKQILKYEKHKQKGENNDNWAPIAWSS